MNALLPLQVSGMAGLLSVAGAYGAGFGQVGGFVGGLVFGGLGVWAIMRWRRASRWGRIAKPREVLDAMPVFVGLIAPDGTVKEVNRAALDRAGLRREQVLGLKISDTYWLNHREEVRTLAADAMRRAAAGEVVRMELPMRVEGDRLISMETVFSPSKDADGSVIAVVMTGVDVTDHKRAKAAVTESELRLKILTENARVGLVLINPERRYIYSNAAYAGILGLQAQDLVGQRVADVLKEAYEDQIRPHLDEAFAGKRVSSELHLRLEETDHSYSVKYEPVMDGAEVSYVVVVIVDITERKLAEEKTRLSEDMFSRAFSSNPAAIVLTRLEDGVVLDVNETWLAMTGETRANVINRSARHMWPSVEEAQRFVAELKKTGGLRGWEQAFRKTTGEHFITQISSQLLTMRGETVILSTLVDITERIRMEDTLRKSEERFRELAETIEDVFWITDPQNRRMIYISPGYEKTWGRTCQSLYDSPRTWLDAIHPEDRERVRRASDASRATGGYSVEYRILRPDGRTRWIRDQAFPVVKAGGEVSRIVGVARDITEFRQLEDQLRQSQKMDAIGQLAGGVAHDFNNILAAILMQADLASRVAGLPDLAKELIHDISGGCLRAADLTRQLLAFGRRQVILPCLLDVNDVVVQISKMLQRIVSATVNMRMELHPRPVMTMADPGSLDQVLLNLVVNARDAMPEGGSVTIETSETELDASQAAVCEVPAGRYACLSVTDTGCGIPAEILPRIFEPFFTTKEAGKGVGLGLATVFGIVKQQGGAIIVDSVPDQGTTFRVLFPSAGAAEKPAETRAAAAPRGGDETILLVEDDDSLRLIATMVLEQAGYRIITACHGTAALEAWEKRGPEIQLMLTDMIMPKGPGGHELAGILQSRNPALKVIFTSGYSPDISGRQTSLFEGRNFLQKPYEAATLLRTVRGSLDGWKADGGA